MNFLNFLVEISFAQFPYLKLKATELDKWFHIGASWLVFPLQIVRTYQMICPVYREAILLTNSDVPTSVVTCNLSNTVSFSISLLSTSITRKPILDHPLSLVRLFIINFPYDVSGPRNYSFFSRFMLFHSTA